MKLVKPTAGGSGTSGHPAAIGHPTEDGKPVMPINDTTARLLAQKVVAIIEQSDVFAYLRQRMGEKTARDQYASHGYQNTLPPENRHPLDDIFGEEPSLLGEGDEPPAADLLRRYARQEGTGYLGHARGSSAERHALADASYRVPADLDTEVEAGTYNASSNQLRKIRQKLWADVEAAERERGGPPLTRPTLDQYRQVAAEKHRAYAEQHLEPFMLRDEGPVDAVGVVNHAAHMRTLEELIFNRLLRGGMPFGDAVRVAHVEYDKLGRSVFNVVTGRAGREELEHLLFLCEKYRIPVNKKALVTQWLTQSRWRERGQ
jgi:hypothetical protein